MTVPGEGSVVDDAATMPVTRLAARRAAEILEARTRQLARRSAAASAVTQPVLACAVGAEFYGIAVAAVARVLPFAPCARVPGTPPAMLGLFGRSGQLFNVLELAIALGLETGRDPGLAGMASRAGDQTDRQLGEQAGYQAGHLLLLRHAPRRFALRVDRVLGVAQVTPIAATDAPRDRYGDPGGDPGGGIVGGHAPLPAGLLPGPPRLLSLILLDRLLRPFLAPDSRSVTT